MKLEVGSDNEKQEENYEGLGDAIGSADSVSQIAKRHEEENVEELEDAIRHGGSASIIVERICPFQRKPIRAPSPRSPVRAAKPPVHQQLTCKLKQRVLL